MEMTRTAPTCRAPSWSPSRRRSLRSPTSARVGAPGTGAGESSSSTPDEGPGVDDALRLKKRPTLAKLGEKLSASDARLRFDGRKGKALLLTILQTSDERSTWKLGVLSRRALKSEDPACQRAALELLKRGDNARNPLLEGARRQLEACVEER